ncbi:hypothetical protein PRK78_005459 [Emydomyces testavorans]|uniref:Tse2 ADP-ribosyltransferase toxin domain-containing protein n=1 Tax=Emydomyces testavorans TaxID=2070801 RepID=A0AAF0DLR9_9EURO|nr:hypothetical protein PRK78_005459 [Emydomyces testavorans]
MSNNRFIQAFTRIPKELFRLNNGKEIRLRAHPGPRRPWGLFDLLTEAGKVKPKALDPVTYEFPNGASMRPNSIKQQRLVRSVRGPDIYVYSILEGVQGAELAPLDGCQLDIGTELPDDLIIVHEFRDHYSLQARKEMTVEGTRNGVTEEEKYNADVLLRLEHQNH